MTNAHVVEGADELIVRLKSLCIAQKQWKASAKWKFWHLNDRPTVYRTLI